jgi:hypothetical protein
MKQSSEVREWLRPTLGAVLMLVGAGGLAYKVISGYRHPDPEAFVSVQDQKKQPTASTADHPAEVPAVSADVATPAQSTSTAAPSAPIKPAPPVVTGDHLNSASSAEWDVNPPAEVQDNSACVAITTEQREIKGALNKPNSPQEGRYLQRRLLELAEQSVKRNCVESTN